MDSSALVALGAAMLRYRLARGLSLRQLAARLGMQGHGGLSDYEKGRRLAPADLIERYEEQLQITDGELRALRTAALAERATGKSDPAKSPAVTIAELPAAPPDFQGRNAELASVLAAAADCLAGRGPVTVVVTGQPGAGKTTLAVRAAQQAFRLGLRDAQFFVELGAADPEAVLRRLLRALGVPDAQLPSEADEAAAMFRSRMAGRRCVLVLDNARDEGQVRALLPGPGPVLVVVTSRQRMSGLAGARRVSLAELTPADARALLTEIVGTTRAEAEPESVAEVVAACGRLRWRCGSLGIGWRPGRTGRSPISLSCCATNRTGSVASPRATWPCAVRSRCPTARSPPWPAGCSGGWRSCLAPTSTYRRLVRCWENQQRLRWRCWQAQV
ncbi:hypothetical protein GCM10029976_006600 [Kribbella albertanoniae]